MGRESNAKWQVATILLTVCLFALPANAEVLTDAAMLYGIRGQDNFTVPFIIKPTYPVVGDNSTELKGAAPQRDIAQCVSLHNRVIEVIFDSGSSFSWVFGKDVNKEYFNNRFHHRFRPRQRQVHVRRETRRADRHIVGMPHHNHRA